MTIQRRCWFRHFTLLGSHHGGSVAPITLEESPSSSSGKTRSSCSFDTADNEKKPATNDDFVVGVLPRAQEEVCRDALVETEEEAPPLQSPCSPPQHINTHEKKEHQSAPSVHCRHRHVRFAHPSTNKIHENTYICREDVPNLWYDHIEYQAFRHERTDSARHAKKWMEDEQWEEEDKKTTTVMEQVFDQFCSMAQHEEEEEEEEEEFDDFDSMMNEESDDASDVEEHLDNQKRLLLAGEGDTLRLLFRVWMEHASIGGGSCLLKGDDDDDEDECWWGLERLYCPRLTLDRRAERSELLDTLRELQTMDILKMLHEDDDDEEEEHQQTACPRDNDDEKVVVVNNGNDSDDDDDDEASIASQVVAAHASRLVSRPSELFCQLWAHEVHRILLRGDE